MRRTRLLWCFLAAIVEARTDIWYHTKIAVSTRYRTKRLDLYWKVWHHH